MKTKCTWIIWDDQFSNTPEQRQRLSVALNGWQFRPTKKSAMRYAKKIAEKCQANVEFFPNKWRSKFNRGKGRNLRTFVVLWS